VLGVGFVRPSGAGVSFCYLPTACAVGSILFAASLLDWGARVAELRSAGQVGHLPLRGLWRFPIGDHFAVSPMAAPSTLGFVAGAPDVASNRVRTWPAP